MDLNDAFIVYYLSWDSWEWPSANIRGFQVPCGTTRIVTSGAWYLCQCEVNRIPIASPSSNTGPRFAMQIPVVYLLPLAWASSPGKYRGNLAATHVRLGQFHCVVQTPGRLGAFLGENMLNFWEKGRKE